MRVIKVCPGIGDNIWLLMKLVNAGERFIFHLPNGKPQRGKQIFDLFPQVAAAAEYVAGSKKVKDISANSISKVWFSRRIFTRTRLTTILGQCGTWNVLYLIRKF